MLVEGSQAGVPFDDMGMEPVGQRGELQNISGLSAPAGTLLIDRGEHYNTLRFLQGEDLITHLGQEYYD